nr:hypothetical protein [Tanacetum cinerariifolium]
MDLPSLTSPWEKETMYAYLAISAEAVSAVLLTDRKGRQCSVQYVSRTLSKAERNYAPMEKMALSLIHMTRRLRRREEELYFRMPEVALKKDDTESWTLFTDEASSSKGSGATLVLIGPSDIEYTYALRLTFPSTNNEA